MFRSDRGLPSNRTVVTALGCSIFRMSAREVLHRMTTRATLMPPPVDPAQAPMNIRITRMAWENTGQVLKSAVAKPVVVMMEVTWKKAYRRELPTEP